MASIRIEVFRGKKGLYEIKDEWDSIVNNLKHKHIFHLYQWHKSYIETLEDNDSDVYYVLMYRDNTPFAIFPIEMSTINIFGLKFNILRIPYDRDMDIVDFIYNKRESNENLLRLIVDNLKTYILCKDCIEILDMFMNSEAPYNV